MKALLRIWKGKYGNIHVVASLAAGLSQYHDSLGVSLVDCLLENVRFGIEVSLLLCRIALT